MNPNNLAMMSAEEVEEYAEMLGISVGNAKSAAAKAKIIERRRAKEVTLTVLGLDLTIPIKRMHDKRVSDLYGKANRSDAETDELVTLILGEGQFAALAEACTDEDGTVDMEAMAYAFVKIVYSEQLKNF